MLEIVDHLLLQLVTLAELDGDLLNVVALVQMHLRCFAVAQINVYDQQRLLSVPFLLFS